MPSPVAPEYTPLPPGWGWLNNITTDVFGEVSRGAVTLTHTEHTTSTAAEAYRLLWEWGVENNCLLQPTGNSVSIGTRLRGHAVVNVYPNMRTPEHQRRYWGNQFCRYGYDHGPARTQAFCEHGALRESLIPQRRGSSTYDHVPAVWNPDRQAYEDAGAVANLCYQPAPESVVAHREEAEHYMHANGAHISECGNVAPRSSRGCSECFVRVPCDQCGDPVEEVNLIVLPDGERVCANCREFWCDECEAWDEDDRCARDEDGRYLCTACYRRAQSADYETYDEDQDATDPTELLLLPNLHRPVRTCSIELETVDGGNRLARALYDEQLCGYPEVSGYHSSGEFDSFCHVERDSSLGSGGGELIFDRISLDDPDDVANLHRAITVVRNQIKSGNLGINMRCGLHVHVDAHQFGIGHARNLVLVTNYLEDVIFRLAAAKYQRHRGLRYSNPIEKGPYPDKRSFGINFLNNNGHNHALNMSHYWQAVRSLCQCGAAMVGEHEGCTCNLGKCTFEFRFFNGTANFRKVHCYASLAQSLVAYARLPHDLTEEQFEPQVYDGRQTAAGQAKMEKWDERLRWMLRALYFSPEERESLRYCVNNSQLAQLGPERIEDIFTTDYVAPDAPEQTITKRTRNTQTPRLQRRR